MMDYVKDRNRRTFGLLCSGSPVTTKNMENKRRGQGKSRERVTKEIKVWVKLRKMRKKSWKK